MKSKRVIMLPLWLYLIVSMAILFALGFGIYIVFESIITSFVIGGILYSMFIIWGRAHVKPKVKENK